MAWRISLSVRALSLRMFLALESILVRASSRCSVETNSSFMASASRWAASSTRTNSLLGCGGEPPLTLGNPLQLGADDAFQLGAIDADAVQERRDHAVGLVQQGVEQVQRLDLRMAVIGRQGLGIGTASWPLIVSFSKRNAIYRSPFRLGQGVTSPRTRRRSARLRRRLAGRPAAACRPPPAAAAGSSTGPPGWAPVLA